MCVCSVNVSIHCADEFSIPGQQGDPEDVHSRGSIAKQIGKYFLKYII